MDPSLVSIGQQPAVVGPPLRSSAFLARLVVGQFCLAVLQRPGQVGHAPSQGTQQGVGGAGVPLEGAALRQHVDVGQALDDAQDLESGAGRVHQLAGAAERGKGLLHHLLLAGAQHGRWNSVRDVLGPRLRAGVDAGVRHAPEVPAAPAVNAESWRYVAAFVLVEAATDTSDETRGLFLSSNCWAPSRMGHLRRRQFIFHRQEKQWHGVRQFMGRASPLVYTTAIISQHSSETFFQPHIFRFMWLHQAPLLGPMRLFGNLGSR